LRVWDTAVQGGEMGGRAERGVVVVVVVDVGLVVVVAWMLTGAMAMAAK
jgi:hypothetical protein